MDNPNKQKQIIMKKACFGLVSMNFHVHSVFLT